MLVMLITRPRSRLTNGRKAFVTNITPSRFTSITERYSAWVCHSIGATDPMMPALLTSAQSPMNKC
ncbi:hypothetical protein DPMN_058917 [Dreissena polymorpha]|uniref:Uncharacterized protein n=1 Tax=Dreissena polymorpha TaxID=45954 RepID=A0A9D4C2M0_DREPO|nr:hypothetical protein DPMN_058917 [Dreissena polymorpha]